MDVALIVIILSFVILITTRFMFSVRISFNVYKNSGKIKVLLFNAISIFCADFSFMGLYLNIKRKNKKAIKIYLYYNKQDFVFINNLQAVFFYKINIVDFNYNINFASLDCFRAIDYYNKIKVVSAILNSILVKKIDSDKFTSSINAGFSSYDLIFNLSMKFIISIFDIIWIVFYVIFLRRSVYGQIKKF